ISLLRTAMISGLLVRYSRQFIKNSRLANWYSYWEPILNKLIPIGNGPSLVETSLRTRSASPAMIILAGNDESLNGTPIIARLSVIDLPALLRYNDLNDPSNKTAAGIFALLKSASSGVLRFSFKLMSAGVVMVRELADEESNTVLLIPTACTVSIEFTNRPATG